MVRPVSRCSADHAVAAVPLPDWDGVHHAGVGRAGLWLAGNRRSVPGGLLCSRRRPQPGLGLGADASFLSPGARPTACLSIRSPIRWWYRGLTKQVDESVDAFVEPLPIDSGSRHQRRSLEHDL